MGCYQFKPSSRKLNYNLQNKYLSHQTITNNIQEAIPINFNILCDLAQIIARNVNNKCVFSYSTILEFLRLMNTQQINYQQFTYFGEDTYSLVLKAEKLGNNQEEATVHLKIYQYGQNNSQILEAKIQFSLLQEIPHSNYIAKISQQFDLISSEKDSSRIQFSNSRFFVQELDISSGNLKEMIQKCKENNTNLAEQLKEILVIQMLDAVNMLHSRGVIHRNIKSSNFLVSYIDNCPVMVKLSGLDLVKQKITINKQNNAEIQNQTMLTPNQARNQNIQSDLMSLGIVILELDNLETFDFSYVTFQEFNKLGEGDIFEDYHLNRNSFLYKIATTFLSKSNFNTQSAHTMLLELLKRNSSSNDRIEVFSIVLRNHLELFHINIPDQKKKQIISDNQDLLLHQTQINQEISQQSQSQKYLTPELIKSALQIMLSWDNYSGEFDLLNVNPVRIIFSTKNIKDNRNCILKLSLLTTNKADILRQIGLMRLCSTPNIVEFYGYNFFEDNNKNEFIVLEYEKCRYSLRYYLAEQEIRRGQQGEDQQRIQNEVIMNQMINSVDFLHINNITHNNINIDNFLVAEELDELGQVIIKLSNFYYATMTQPQEQLALLFNEVNKTNLQDVFYSSTEQSDYVSLAICLIILDNYFNYQEQQSIQTYNYSKYVKHSLQDSNDINNFIQNSFESIDKTSKIYQQALKYLQIPRNQTNQCNIQLFHNTIITQIISQTNNFHHSLISNKLLSLDIITSIIELESNYCYLKDLKNFTHLKRLSITISNSNKRMNTKLAGSMLSPLKYIFNLSSLSLTLHTLWIENDQLKQIISSITHLSSLINLSLDLSNNLIRDIFGGQSPLHPLINLINLSNLSINLSSNYLGDNIGSSMLSPINNLNNLTYLTLNLSNNSINSAKALTYLNTLSHLINLMYLSLNLSNNQINPEESNNLTSSQQSLLSPLSSLTNLQILSLNLSYNQIKDISINSLLSPISNLTQISNLTINLKHNQIQDLNVSFLLSPLSNYMNIQTLSLNLSSNLIRDTNTKTMLSFISNLQNLITLSLNLSENQISNLGVKQLFIPLSNLMKLQTLQINLDYNKIGPNGAQSLLPFISNLTNLKNLDLSLFMSQIGNIGSRDLLFQIIDLINIQTLCIDLSSNNIQFSVAATSLLSPLAGLYNLQILILDLSKNDIRDNSNYNYLLFPLRNLVKLSTLSINLSYNRIKDSIAVKSMLQPISNLVNLSKLSLNLSNNKINSDGVQYLLSPLLNLLNLQDLSLDMHFNYLGDIGIQYLLTFITKFSNISNLSLNLQKIQLTDIGIQSLVMSLTNLQQIQNLLLNLQKNQLSCKGVQCILSYLSNQNNLSSLQLNLFSQNKQIQKILQHLPQIMFQNIKTLQIS